MQGFWSFVKEHQLLSGTFGVLVATGVTVGMTLVQSGRDSGPPPAVGNDPSPTITRADLEGGDTATQSPTRSPAPSGTPVVSAPPTGLLQSGDLIEDSLDTLGDRDEWTFYGEKDQFVVVRIDADSSSNIEPDIVLLNPFGDQAARKTLGSYAQLEYYLEFTGEHTIQVGDRLSKGRGLYTMRMALDPFEALSIGSTLTGEITKPGEKHWYRFTAAAGQVVSIIASRDPTGNMRPGVGLYDPFRNSEANNSGNDFVNMTVELKDSGGFTVVVQDRLSVGKGKYTLEVTLR